MGLGRGAKGWRPEQPGNLPPVDSSAPVTKNIPIEPKVTSSVNVEELESKTDLLLKEYLSLADTTEAIMCIRELNAPSYFPGIKV